MGFDATLSWALGYPRGHPGVELIIAQVTRGPVQGLDREVEIQLYPTIPIMNLLEKHVRAHRDCERDKQ
jgi:hypothetical protein